MISAPAHPRSRGENTGGQLTKVRHPGSSPLTRGKRPRYADQAVRPRLIPAHAGKTTNPDAPVTPETAHPRSRGENVDALHPFHQLGGSSPLTRGKPRRDRRDPDPRRLIPAHAGKTAGELGAGIVGAAHPRSRGENIERSCRAGRLRGSSPLTRGKLSGRPT